MRPFILSCLQNANLRFNGCQEDHGQEHSLRILSALNTTVDSIYYVNILIIESPRPESWALRSTVHCFQRT